MNSAERVLHYANDIETENQKGRDAPLGWPYKGRIEIRNLTMRYAPYLPPTIRDVSLDIDSHEKVGIVGRTGAGKSSIIMTLFRMVEPELYSMVRIDDESIMDMRLNDLRRGISIIPQEPILFSGTIRFNMDPFNEHSDDDIWYALENSGMKQFVKDMDKQLDSEVRPNGENFSVGQRQLLCLARAMIRGSHILIMDEATASVDIETDAIIQRALRTNFSEATVLTIAHRLNTIIDYDKILVLDKGELLEFDSPKNLLFEKNENGDLVPTNKTEFSKLVDETGPSSAEALRRAALEKQ
jgi:ABC-type multidrug transport system fused ATPase/permease subunit